MPCRARRWGRGWLWPKGLWEQNQEVIAIIAIPHFASTSTTRDDEASKEAVKGDDDDEASKEPKGHDEGRRGQQGARSEPINGDDDEATSL